MKDNRRKNNFFRSGIWWILVSFPVMFCSWSQPKPSDQIATVTPTPTDFGINPEDAEWDLEFEAYGELPGEVAQTTGPLTVVIPLAKDGSGYAGRGEGVMKETASGGCVGERTSEVILDVTATGNEILEITVVWTTTNISETGICFGMNQEPVTVASDPVEVPAKDGASKKIDFPQGAGGGFYYELYTLRRR